MKNHARVYATIDLDAVVSNMEAMKNNISPNTGIIGVVKADGYGHGAVPVAFAIAPYVSGYAVANIEEALILRRHGISKPIMILGVTHPSQYKLLIQEEIRPTIFTMEQAIPLSEIALSLETCVKFHLAVDTGMSRIGVAANETGAELTAEIAALSGLELEGAFTHFSKADERDKTSANQQLTRYFHFVALLQEKGIEIPVKHCSNSAGIIDIPNANLDMVRAGISIYGMYPSGEVLQNQVALLPVMGLKSHITYIKTIEAGCEVSYGGTFVAAKEMRIATIPVGYADGYPRNLSGKGYVLIHGKKANILGRICMDQFMVDVTDIPESKVDDDVTLIGTEGKNSIRVEDLATLGGGFHYEIVCGISKRVPRVFFKEGALIGRIDYFQDIYSDFIKKTHN